MEGLPAVEESMVAQGTTDDDDQVDELATMRGLKWNEDSRWSTRVASGPA